MRNAFRLLTLALVPAALYADPPRILRASFPDGTALEILTQTTGSSPIDPRGAMGIGPGRGPQDMVNRVVVDRAGKILFAYNLEASRGAAPRSVKIRIEPISPASEATIIKSAGMGGRPRFTGAHLPTVAAVREFPSVQMGQAVTLDILQNPSTGEKIYDVLRPIAGSASVMSVESVPTQETISLNRITVRVNGKSLPAPSSVVMGEAVRIDIPRHGAYILAAADPHQADFTRIARADGKTLTWTTGGDRFEITSAASVLTQAVKGELWVFQDRHHKPDVVSLQSADTVDWLLPKR
jgi:hypothetical protein